MSEAKDQIAIIYAQGGGEGDVNARRFHATLSARS
jgi:hypothetical protein